MSPPPSDTGTLSNINHFVVLMLENRSFDHLLGSLERLNPAIQGVLDGEFANAADPTDPNSTVINTGPADQYALAFDPGHEFLDVQIQLYGRTAGSEREPGPRTDPAPMSGFVFSAMEAATTAPSARAVMQSFQPAQLPALMTLAQEFAVFNHWHSPLPGPTWPNRFFVHAATSGGLSDSPNDADILAGFRFPTGTIFQLLERAGQRWYIYHDGLPQTAGIDHLRGEFLDVFTQKFRDMSRFTEDLAAADWPEYVFIEPRYDTAHQYVQGNSMHPRNDVRHGEALVKQVYEAIRASRYWADTLLVITFDEHGGFFDHVPPPAATPPGGSQEYANRDNHFDFDRLGVRVPAIVVSPYTRKGTVIGDGPQDAVDHTAILKTLEKRFSLPPLTERDAHSPTLESALNLSAPRLSATDAPLTLPGPVADSLLTEIKDFIEGKGPDEDAPLSPGQRAQLALAHACNDKILTDPAAQQAASARFRNLRGQRDAADYVTEVEQRIRSRRRR